MRNVIALLVIAILPMLAGCGGGGGGGSNTTDVTKPTVTGFAIPATGTSLTVAVTTLSATDNVAVIGYLLTESATAPSSSATGWSATAPTSHTFGTIPNAVATPKTLFAWAKDAAGNVSTSLTATTIITLPAVGAVLTLSSQGTLPAGKAVAGFGATIELPAGLTAQTVTGGAVAPNVVVASGLLAGSAGTMGPVTYTPATATAKAKLDFTMASTAVAGVGVGEYATITLILTGVNPVMTDFNVTSFTPVDLSFANLSALTPALSLSVF